ncbi:MAG: energy transducer TonB [Paracoccaceae bacterium]
MDTGQTISVSVHTLLIGWVIFGGVFQSEPLPFEVQSVSMITSEQFAALTAPDALPEATTDVVAPETPEPQEAAPELPEPVEAPPPPPQPEAAEEVVEDAPSAPPEDTAILLPETNDDPTPQDSERVAPEVVTPPDPEAAPDEVEQEAVTEDQSADRPAEEQEATAPEEATTEIVTEAEEPSGRLTSSLRPPQNRPAPPASVDQEVPPEEVPAAEEPAASDTDDAVRAALEGAAEPDVPTGPPLSAGEKDALRVAVSSCWNVGSLSSEALRTTVVVDVAMNQDGTPQTGSIRMASFSGGSESAARQAFEAARRAIIRCGARGFDLPVEKYGQWQEIEMTFNPEGMRLR